LYEYEYEYEYECECEYEYGYESEYEYELMGISMSNWIENRVSEVEGKKGGGEGGKKGKEGKGENEGMETNTHLQHQHLPRLHPPHRHPPPFAHAVAYEGHSGAVFVKPGSNGSEGEASVTHAPGSAL
jgi:hypothetical protein